VNQLREPKLKGNGVDDNTSLCVFEDTG